ncbi:unnamed protein product [Effrenium voratum]|nr:unnamed protein product [Effrenium voratum]
MDAHAPQLAEVCMRQAVRLEQLHAELDKARRSESAALEELEKRREAHEQERAEMRDKVARMAVFQEALQRENGLLLEELVSVLGRAKALKAEMAWIQRFLPMTEPVVQRAPSPPSAPAALGTGLRVHPPTRTSPVQVVSPVPTMPIPKVPAAWLGSQEPPRAPAPRAPCSRKDPSVPQPWRRS